ncbi:unnamed protein product [Blepharisma stoltei]|uniref:Uncharacterized protein n=1 Tax=Blepharisma stoltei TaxID=1481888 RepID=A0AAU9J1H6_9CILI|nr:unnamed protein product [Blepharisma stoltei]
MGCNASQADKVVPKTQPGDTTIFTIPRPLATYDNPLQNPSLAELLINNSLSTIQSVDESRFNLNNKNINFAIVSEKSSIIGIAPIRKILNLITIDTQTAHYPRNIAINLYHNFNIQPTKRQATLANEETQTFLTAGTQDAEMQTMDCKDCCLIIQTSGSFTINGDTFKNKRSKSKKKNRKIEEIYEEQTIETLGKKRKDLQEMRDKSEDEEINGEIDINLQEASESEDHLFKQGIQNSNKYGLESYKELDSFQSKNEPTCQEEKIEMQKKISELEAKIRELEQKNKDLEIHNSQEETVPIIQARPKKTETSKFVKTLKKAHRHTKSDIGTLIMNRAKKETPNFKYPEILVSNDNSIIEIKPDFEFNRNLDFDSLIDANNKDLLSPESAFETPSKLSHSKRHSISDAFTADDFKSTDFYDEFINNNPKYKRDLHILTPQPTSRSRINSSIQTPVGSSDGTLIKTSKSNGHHFVFSGKASPSNISYSSKKRFDFKFFTPKAVDQPQNSKLKYDLLDSERKRHIMALKIYQKNQTAPKDNLSKLIDEIIDEHISS